MPGMFVTLEGVEGTGKSTLTARLISDLIELGIPAIATREPGGSSIGAPIRALLLDPDLPALNPHTEALLFAADRAQHVAELITPALDDGKIVICDRYIDSSAAYQGVGRDLGVDEIRRISLWGTQNRIPDLTILIDLNPRIGLTRKTGDEVNRMEQQKLAFHETVREALLRFARLEPDRFFVIDGTLPLGDVYALLKKRVMDEWALHSHKKVMPKTEKSKLEKGNM
jgi:dTMP kinase